MNKKKLIKKAEGGLKLHPYAEFTAGELLDIFKTHDPENYTFTPEQLDSIKTGRKLPELGGWKIEDPETGYSFTVNGGTLRDGGSTTIDVWGDSIPPSLKKGTYYLYASPFNTAITDEDIAKHKNVLNKALEKYNIQFEDGGKMQQDVFPVGNLTYKKHVKQETPFGIRETSSIISDGKLIAELNAQNSDSLLFIPNLEQKVLRNKDSEDWEKYRNMFQDLWNETKFLEQQPDIRVR